MQFLSALLLAGLAFTGTAALSHTDVAANHKSSCPPFNGSFVIDYYQLYPENADFDFDSCLLYIGIVWNGTVGIYDPYINKMLDIVEFPGISHTGTYHVGGTSVDERTGLLSILVDAWEPVVSGGTNLTGDNFFLQWDPATKQVLYKLNLTETTQEKYAGFATIAHDPDDNAYVVGRLPSSILKVDKHGKTVTPWYLPQPIIPTNAGLGSIAATGWTLLASDANSTIRKFDMRKPLGVPVEVPHYPNVNWTITDSGYMPPLHKGTVYLLAEDLVGVIVLRSKDGLWNTAEFLGKVLNPVPNSYTTEPVQIGNSLYLVPTDVGNISHINTGPGSQDKFPFIDITDQVDALLEA
ncbi:hypothetical protein N431DRAFT_393725 [Stipitochalara longipes BDJ]|nr:hypothetical protein N431DRAFT_393725 [Stipitochalara longipes BDJ]